MSSSLLRNISWLGFANLAVKPFWFLFITAACMRVLGAEGYGVLSAALSLTLIGTILIDLGMVRYSVREVARDHAQASRFFTNLLALRAVTVVGATAVTVPVAWLLGYHEEALLAVAFACVYTFAMELVNYCRSFYQAFENLRLEAILLFAEKLLVIGGGLLLLFTTRQAHWTLAGMGAGMVLTAGLHVAWIGRHLAPFRPALLDRRFIGRAVRLALPLGLGGVFLHTYFRMGLVMVEAMRGEVAAGQYGAAFRILEALNLLPSVIATAAVYPRLSRLQHAGWHTEARALLRRSLLGLGLLSGALALALTFFGPQVIHLLDPAPLFVPAGPALQVLGWAFPFFCLNSLLYSALLTLDDERFTTVALGGALAVNVAFNAVAIPAYGIQGAAVAAIVPEVLLTALYLVRYYRRAARYAAGDAPAVAATGPLP